MYTTNPNFYLVKQTISYSASVSQPSVRSPIYFSSRRIKVFLRFLHTSYLRVRTPWAYKETHPKSGKTETVLYLTLFNSKRTAKKRPKLRDGVWRTKTRNLNYDKWGIKARIVFITDRTQMPQPPESCLFVGFWVIYGPLSSHKPACRLPPFINGKPKPQPFKSHFLNATCLGETWGR